MTTSEGVAGPSDRATRLVATIGPASVDVVEDLVRVGLDVARINLSHGARDEHLRSAAAVRAAASAVGRSVGLLVDLPGPKLRVGDLPEAGLLLASGATLALTGPDVPAAASLPLADADVLDRLVTGDRILLADGEAELRVTVKGSTTVQAEVVRGGRVRARQGASVPAERMVPDAWRDADEALIPHLLELEPDFVGQSFVREAGDVRTLRARLPEGTRIVAKIETRPAVEGIEAILLEADAIMVARGDLGVELPFERVPLVQKDLVRAAGAAGRPSIVATQMLESMVHAPRPTRAEASDVANAVLDGADAVMLSAETAIGSWPVEALRAAGSICTATERYGSAPPAAATDARPIGIGADVHALAAAAVAIAEADDDVILLVCYTHSGRTARLLSALRPRVPIVAFTSTAAGARGLALRRGVRAVPLPLDDDDAATVAGAVRSALDGLAETWSMPRGRGAVLVQTSARGGPNALEVLRL